jgi:type I restriction enzyme, S subunit
MGTTVIHLGKADIDRFVALNVTDGLLEVWSEIGEPLLDRMIINSAQNQALAKLRETLLPPLISGELRLRAAERQVEAALS